MGKQRIVAITAEVGGPLTPGDLQPPPENQARRDDSWMWRNLFGAAASGADPEAAAMREQRRLADSQAIGQRIAAAAEITGRPGQQ